MKTIVAWQLTCSGTEHVECLLLDENELFIKTTTQREQKASLYHKVLFINTFIKVNRRFFLCYLKVSMVKENLNFYGKF
jgi:hypothetical protein